MLGSLPSLKPALGAPLQSRKAMLETLFRHLDMVRLSAGAALLLTMASCTGLIDGAGDGLTSQERTARQKWSQNALPLLKANCGSCHGGSRMTIDFMTGGTDLEIRDRIKVYTPSVVNLDAPSSSRLVVKGQHDGPAFSVEDRSTILLWLEAEQSASSHDPITNAKPIATAAVAIQPCTSGLPPAPTCPTNEISLTDVPDIGAMVRDLRRMGGRGPPWACATGLLAAPTRRALSKHVRLRSHTVQVRGLRHIFCLLRV